MRLFTVLFALATVAFAAAPAHAELHALLLGVDDYVVKRPKLGGAVNDAVGIADVLKQRGVTDVVLLTDRAATRDGFEANWQAMVGRAKSGDVLLLTFAGHGMRTPETGAVKHTVDGFDKGFVLAPYDETKAPEELLRDEHLYDLFKSASDKGLRIVFVADACHSGLTIRGIGDAPGLPSRETSFLPRYDTGTGPVVPAESKPLGAARPDIPGVSIFSATEPQFTIKELLLDGRPHGALSYEVARGLAGEADDSGQGMVDVGKLRNYVAPLIRSDTKNSQVPHFLVPDESVVLVSDGRAIAPAPPALPPLPVIKVAVAGASLGSLEGAVATETAGEAEFTWDVARAEVRGTAGDRLATGIGPSQIQGVVDAHRLLAALRQAMQARGAALSTRIRPLGADGKAGPATDANYVGGSNARFESDPTEFRFVTVFDVNANGTVQFMYPLAQDPIQLSGDDALHFDSPVTPPFGADFVVFIATPEPLTGLHQVLKGLNAQVAAGSLYSPISRALVGKRYQIGIQAAYTCERLGANGQCVTSSSQP